MCSLVQLLSMIIDIATWLLIANVLLSWLTAFGVLNMRHRIVYQIASSIYSATEPMVGPVRRLLPPMGGLDFSPIVVFLLLGFLKSLLWEYGGPSFCMG
ncbi:MAG: YggT family protein [Alphaproteobacteria bacterium]|jgi:YggT family protein|nr:YggT family protein [Alphaproteobacteria bacterium]